MLVFLYIVFIALAFLGSILLYDRRNPAYLRIFSIILGCDLIIEIAANYLLKPLHLHSNNGLYNVAMLIEFWGYAYYYSYVIQSRLVKKIISVYLVLFPVIWVVLVFLVQSFNFWNSYLSVIGSLVLIILSACMYYQIFTADKLIKLTTSFGFWIATGLIIFYSCNFVYLGMLNYLSIKYRGLASNLLQLLQVLNIVYYAIVLYAFICLWNSTKKAKKQFRIF